jgi:hypothetical protein
MSLELLKHCLNYEFYSKNKANLDPEFFPSDIRKIYLSLQEYWDSQIQPKFISDESIAISGITAKDLRQYHLSRYPAITNTERSNLNIVFENLGNIEIGQEAAEAILRNEKLKLNVTKLANEALNMADGHHRDFGLLENLVARVKGEYSSDEDDLLPVTDDIDELMALSEHAFRWKFCLDNLKDKINGVGPGIFGLIAARPECFSSDTEILTTTGFKLIKDVTKLDMVAQVNPITKTWDFTNPLDVVGYYVKEQLLHVYSNVRGVNYLVTKNHDLAFEHTNGTMFKVKAEDATFSSLHRHIQVKPYALGGDGLTWLDRFLIAYQADGSASHNPNSTGKRCGTLSVRFTLKREDKKARLINILNNLTFLWEEKQEATRPGFSTFYVKIPTDMYHNTIRKDFSWVDIANSNRVWAEEFIEELSYWDASRRSEHRIKYDSVVKINTDVVQALSTMAGYKTTYSMQKKLKEPHHNPINTLHILKNRDYVDAKPLKREWVDYEGTVHCVTVPTGYIIIRRNGQVAISGNCGKTAFVVSLVFHPEGWAKQGAKVAYFGNEEQAFRTKKRGMCCYSGIPESDWEDKKEGVIQKYAEIKNNVYVLDVVGMSTDKMEKWIAKHRPDIVIIDQLDKVRTAGKYNSGHEELRALYTQAREISKKYNCAIIGVSQASADAEGKLYYGFDMLEGSKTGKAAETDLIITIGKQGFATSQGEDNGFRVANICKNKLTGWHGNVSFMLDSPISRITQ